MGRSPKLWTSGMALCKSRCVRVQHWSREPIDGCQISFSRWWVDALYTFRRPRLSHAISWWTWEGHSCRYESRCLDLATCHQASRSMHSDSLSSQITFHQLGRTIQANTRSFWSSCLSSSSQQICATTADTTPGDQNHSTCSLWDTSHTSRPWHYRSQT